MSALQEAAGFFAREAARYQGLKEAADKFTTAAALEQYVNELQAKVDALGKELGTEGLRARAATLHLALTDLEQQHAEASKKAADAKAEHADWVAKNTAHAEKAKTWNGESDRVLAKAKADAEDIVSKARGEGLVQARIDAEALRTQTLNKAKTNADEYEASRKKSLVDLEAKIETAQKKLDDLQGKISEGKTKHEEIRKNLAALKARLD